MAESRFDSIVVGSFPLHHRHSGKKEEDIFCQSMGETPTCPDLQAANGCERSVVSGITQILKPDQVLHQLPGGEA